METKPWEAVRGLLGQVPIVSQHLAGPTPVFVERYLFRAAQVAVSGIAVDAAVIHFGGGRVEEGAVEAAVGTRTTRVPMQGMLVPRGTDTHWHYSGPIDFGVFYLLEGGNEIMQGLEDLARSRAGPVPFSDALVSAAGLQLVRELQRCRASPPAFCSRLAAVMLEQLLNILRDGEPTRIDPAHIQLSRIKDILTYVHENPGADLSVDSLASRIGLSHPHFYRIFRQSTGMSPHQYVLEARLQSVRNLLAQSRLPISRIAEYCGFSSASHLTAAFQRVHSTTPAKYRRTLIQTKSSRNEVARASVDRQAETRVSSEYG